MRIAITGRAGSDHKAIANMLAERLTLQAITADTYVEEAEDRFNCYDIAIGDRTVEFNVYVNKRIIEDVLDNDDYVLDSLISFTVPNTIKIYIDRDLTEESVYPASVLESRNTDTEFISKYCFDTKHDIYINRTTLNNQQVIDFIMDTLVQGDTGDFVPLNLCIPHQALIARCCKDYKYFREVEVDTYNNLYIITNYKTYINKNHNGIVKLSHVNVTDEAQLKHPAYYLNWFGQFVNGNIAMLNLMLNRHCENKQLNEVYDTYVKLMHNGDAFNKLLTMEGR